MERSVHIGGDKESVVCTFGVVFGIFSKEIRQSEPFRAMFRGISGAAGGYGSSAKSVSSEPGANEKAPEPPSARGPVGVRMNFEKYDPLAISSGVEAARSRT